MITLYEIQKAKTTIELDRLVERAAAERNCQLDSGSPYAHSAVWFREASTKAGNGADAQIELADILQAAETKWHALEEGGQ